MYKYEIYFKNGTSVNFSSNDNQEKVFSEFCRIGFDSGIIKMNDLLINVSAVSYIIEVKQ